MPDANPVVLRSVSWPVVVPDPGLAMAKPVLNPPDSSTKKSAVAAGYVAGTEASEKSAEPLNSWKMALPLS